MKRRTQLLVFMLFSATGLSQAAAITVFFGMGDSISPSAGDIEQMSWFTDRGYTLDIWDNAAIGSNSGIEALDAANAADLVYTSESISSGRFRQIESTTSPMILSDGNGADIMGFYRENGGDDYAEGHGSPTAKNPNGFNIVSGTSFGTTISIVNEAHPIAVAAGLSNGDHVVYGTGGAGPAGGRLSWSTVGAGGDLPAGSADIIALLADYDDEYPTASTLFVIEAGKPLYSENISRFPGDADGPLPNAPAMRIFTFLSDTNRGPEDDLTVSGGLGTEADGTGPAWESTILTPAGRALIMASVDYALGLLSTATPGDRDNDGDVDGDDFLAIQLGYGDATTDADFGAWETNFGTVPNGVATSVPEPSTIGILAILVAPVLARRRS